MSLTIVSCCVVSGVVAGGHLYIVNDPGVAQCVELASGKTVWRRRAAGTTWSSAVLSGHLVYATDQSGETVLQLVRTLSR